MACAPVADIAHAPSRWAGLLATPYGAIVEEIQLRVFVMGGIAWMLARFTCGKVQTDGMIVAVAVAALLFGAGHLPLAAKMETLTPSIVLRVIGYNAIGGIIFGWFYWKRGLERAMLAHFALTWCCMS